MKRELDLLRNILLDIEAKWCVGMVLDIDEFSCKDPEKLRYHLQMLIEEGFVKGYIPESTKKTDIHSLSVTGITWKGHDFLDQIRQPDIWTKLKPMMEKYGIECVMTGIKTAVQVGVKSIFPISQNSG